MTRFLSTEIGNENVGSIGAFWEQSLVSLEKSLEPVRSRFYDLDRSIKEAKRRCHYPSEHHLSLDESAAVFLYTMDSNDTSFYRILNESLRSSDRSSIKIWFGFLKLFDSALQKLPTIKRPIWRCLNGDYSHLFKKDEILTWWSVTSCSLSPTAAQRFLGPQQKGTLLMINAKDAKDISIYSNFSDEKEIILKSGTQLRVEDNPLCHPGGLTIIHLSELDDDEVQREKEKARMNLVTTSTNQKTIGTTQVTRTLSTIPTQPLITKTQTTQGPRPHLISEN